MNRAIGPIRNSMRRAVRRSVGTVALALTSASCIDLDVSNPNGLSIETVFTNASNVDAALVGSWKAYTELTRFTCPTLPFSVWGNDITTTSITFIDYSTEPRIPINNRDNLNCATRSGYYVPYEAAAGARESFQGINENRLRFGVVDATTPDGRDTPSRLIFAKFMIAISQLSLGLYFDQAFISDTSTPLGTRGTELSPSSQVIARAVEQLRNVIAHAQSVPSFTLPATFINGRSITRDELVRISMSFIIRSQVYAPRNPAERAAVNWSRVLAQLDSGITRDFGFQADPAVAGTASTYFNNSFAQNTVRISNRLVGPADTSGQYQLWLARPLSTRSAFTLTTPDRRIHGATNTTAGTRFIRLSSTMGSATNGPYLTSAYRSTRYLNTAADSGSRAFVPVLSLDEMKFVRAEALFRLGRATEAAALINPTRVAANLKPVDANGPPAGRDCVPKTDTGACGSLFDAIQYEKRIELYPYSGGEVAWFDQRGWGKLITGTPIHLPVSGRELLTLGLPYYTFGGSGAGSAP
ncbi:MAG: hypothetical protein ACT4OZ_14795 [Gemmatimonadota bacterium]